MSAPVSYSIDGASAATGLAVSKLRTRIRENKLVARYEGKDILIERVELERFIASLPQEREK